MKIARLDAAVTLDNQRLGSKLPHVMKSAESSILFQEDDGKLLAVEVRRSNRRPVISALHRALVAAGVIVTTYQAQTTGGGLRERIELANRDGQRLSGLQSETVRTAVLPLALGDDEPSA